MPFKIMNGGPAWVNPRELDGSKTRASEKKNRPAIEVRRKKDESHIHARLRHMATSASNTKSKASYTESEASYTESEASYTESEAPSPYLNESKMPCVETQELVVAVYFISRSFATNVVEEVLRRRFYENHDPETVAKAKSVLNNGEFGYGKDQYDLNLVDLWLNKQTSYEYGNLLSLTAIDDWIRHIAQDAVGALVLYARSLNLPNTRDKTLMKSHIWR